MTALPKRLATVAASTSGRGNADESLMGAFVRMAEAVGAPPTRLMRDFAALSFGPGRISFTDYERLRLYDEDFWAGGDRRSVAGARRAREIALAVNFRHDWFGITQNRLASSAFLAAHGLPTVPVDALFSEGLATPSVRVLRTRDELRRYLEAADRAPVVGLPTEGGRARAIGRAKVQGDGEIDRLVEDICENHAGGYLFQPALCPDHETSALTGGELAPVRIITLACESGPKLLRAVWPIRGLARLAAQLDLRTGEVLRLIDSDGRDLRGAASPVAISAGARVPQWQTLRAAAIEGARVMQHFGLLGWDVAASPTGPVILGLTPTPDLALCQLADRRGVLDAPFLAYLDERRRLAAEEAALAKAIPLSPNAL